MKISRTLFLGLAVCGSTAVSGAINSELLNEDRTLWDRILQDSGSLPPTGMY